MEMQFEDEWPEYTSIEWWNEGRRKLNEIIRLYNQWQIDNQPAESRQRLANTIEMGIQTFASRAGGSGWRETLCRMRDFVASRPVD